MARMRPASLWIHKVASSGLARQSTESLKGTLIKLRQGKATETAVALGGQGPETGVSGGGMIERGVKLTEATDDAKDLLGMTRIDVLSNLAMTSAMATELISEGKMLEFEAYPRFERCTALCDSKLRACNCSRISSKDLSS